MNYKELFQLQSLVDSGSTSNLTSESRMKIYDMMENIDTICNNYNKQIAKTYGGTLISDNQINFNSIMEEDKLNGTNKFQEVYEKINEDNLQEISPKKMGGIVFNFLNLQEFSYFIKPHIVTRTVTDQNGNNVDKEITLRYTVADERFLKKYLLIKSDATQPNDEPN